MKEQLKSQNGAIATFVIVTIAFFLIILMGAYISTMNLKKSQLQSDIYIQQIYGKDVNNVDQIYEELAKDEMEGYKEEFAYTGAVQEWTVPATGMYKLEVYGAQGGCYTATTGLGGKGGYSVGTCTLEKEQVLYIVIGGMAGTGSTNGGYNGGGYGGLYGTDGVGMGGGGATHIATSNKGTIANYSSNIEDLLIVAGGGGGGMYYKAVSYVGGAGGGTSSQAGNPISGYGTSAAATQSSGFAFGQGGATAGSTNGTRGGGRRRSVWRK